MADIKSFAAPDWTQIWAGNWSLLTCSHFSEQYTRTMVVNGKVFMSKSIIFVKEGNSSGYMMQSDRDAFGRNLAAEVVRTPERVAEITAHFKQQVDFTLEFMREHQSGDITRKI